MSWINVDDQKPNEGDKVLCFGNFFTCVGVYDGDDFFDPLDGQDFVKGCVTHWQPLPDPPEN